VLLPFRQSPGPGRGVDGPGRGGPVTSEGQSSAAKQSEASVQQGVPGAEL